MGSNAEIQKFVAKQRELLDLELHAEREESASDSSGQEKQRSHVLGRLEASGISVGLYGRTVVTLTPWAASTDDTEGEAGGSRSSNAGRLSPSSLLPSHRFAVGNEVEIRAKGGNDGGNSKKNSIRGVICAVAEVSIAVAISEDKQSNQKDINKRRKAHPSDKQHNGNQQESDDETGILDSGPLTLVPSSSIAVHKKLVAALDRLEKHGEDHPIAGSIIRSVFAPSATIGEDGTYFSNPSLHKPAATLQQKQELAQTKTNIGYFDPSLDNSQREAIAFALDSQKPVSLIHGPPGTGKTTTVAELIRQAVHHHGMRVLVTAPSNVAVDNILEKLTLAPPSNTKGDGKKSGLRTVRLGHPARIKPSIARHGLEALVQSSDGTEIVNDIRQELESHLRFLSKGKQKHGSDAKKQSKQQKAKKEPGRKEKMDRKTAYKEIRLLRKEIRQREEKVVRELIGSANVVLATTVGADNRILNQITHPKDDTNSGTDKQSGFDLVIIDEAAQALEASCWIPILRGRKVVLAGDHCQLPPTVKSNDSRVMKGLSVTLFERLMGFSNNNSDENSTSTDTSGRHQNISRMLQIQYRMHHKIADWASQAMYHGELTTHDSVRSRTLGQLDSVARRNTLALEPSSSSLPNETESDDPSNTTLLLIDTAGCDMHERETEAGSRYNEGEAMLVSQHVRKLLDMGMEEPQIAVITPYNGQVELLRKQLLPEFPKLEIRSVDGFQGGEREAVVLSLVRSSDGQRDRAGIGFLSDDRRQNVAVTRAKRHLAVICDSETVSQSRFIQNLLQWIGTHGEERSAIEYIAEGTGTVGHKEYEDDLRLVEAELMKVLEDQSSPNVASPSKAAPTNESSLSKQPPGRNEIKLTEAMEKIAIFVQTGKSGEEMVLSSDLSSSDRRSVHEFAEQMGLGHRSEGRDGIDRKIILWIQNNQSLSSPSTDQSQAKAADNSKEQKNKTSDDHSVEHDTDKEENANIASIPKSVSNAFSALVLDDDDKGGPNDSVDSKDIQDSTVPPAGNSLLAQLAKERAERQQQQQQQRKASSMANSSNIAAAAKKKKKKSKGQRLGGTTKLAPPPPKDDIDDDLDDMAFLDAQIEKTQNAHGRRVVGSGKNYRTVINGVLNSRPEPVRKPTNQRASAALQSKLSQAKNSRQKKKKNKK